MLEGLETAGYPAYVVGGCVRDGLRGLPPHDWDVCTAARPDQVHTALSDEFTVLDTGLRHGTVTAVRNGLHIEITTYRIDGAYSDGRRPDAVQFVDNIEQDLARRDFTVGAIAYSPTRGIVDPYDGQEDLKEGILRCVGNPDARFSEDALRIARGLRLAAEHGFIIDANTAASMRRQQKKLDDIACERIAVELNRLLCGKWAGRVLQTYPDILTQMLPELVPMFGLSQQNHHHKYDVWTHTIHTLGQIPNVPLLRWAMLLHDIGKPTCKTVDTQGTGHFYGHPKVSCQLAEKIAKRLRFSNTFRYELLMLIEHHDHPFGNTPKQMRKQLHILGEKRIRNLLSIKKADVIGQETCPEDIRHLQQTEALLEQVLAEKQCFSLNQLAVNGRDLKECGLAGSEIGQMLNRLLEHVIEKPEDNHKQALFALVQKIESEGKTDA